MSPSSKPSPIRTASTGCEELEDHLRQLSAGVFLQIVTSWNSAVGETACARYSLAEQLVHTSGNRITIAEGC